jgi:hypothetical protein
MAHQSAFEVIVWAVQGRTQIEMSHSRNLWRTRPNLGGDLAEVARWNLQTHSTQGVQHFH